MTVDALSEEQREHYFEVMPELAAAHAADGSFSLLPTDPELYIGQDPDYNFLPSNGNLSADRLPMEEITSMATILVPNIVEIVDDLSSEKASQLVTASEEIRYGQGANVIFVGNHPEVDSIIFPQVAHAAAQRRRSLAADRPTNRTIVTAKALAWYGFGDDAGLDLVRNFSNVVTTAPGTISGKKLDSDTRKYINGRAVPALEQALDEGGQEVTLAYCGATDKTRRFAHDPFLRVQYTVSEGTLALLERPDVFTVPFATHRDELTKKMGIAFGEPRQIESAKEGLNLGHEIAYMSERLSGIPTVQAVDRDQYAELTHGHKPSLFANVREYIRALRREFLEDGKHGTYFVGHTKQ